MKSAVATEAGSIDVLTYKLQEMIPELVDLNNIDVPGPDCRKDFDIKVSKLRHYN